MVEDFSSEILERLKSLQPISETPPIENLFSYFYVGVFVGLQSALNFVNDINHEGIFVVTYITLVVNLCYCVYFKTRVKVVC